MTAPSIPTRLGQIAERENRPEEADAINSLGFEEQQQRTDDLLKQLSDTFEGHWSSASIDLESDDYFVCALRSGLTTGRCVRAAIVVSNMVVQRDVRAGNWQC